MMPSSHKQSNQMKLSKHNSIIGNHH